MVFFLKGIATFFVSNIYKNIYIKYGILLLVSVYLKGCKFIESNNNESSIKLASVNRDVLYLRDLSGFVFTEMSKEDSILFVRKYIDDWIIQKLLLEKAEENLKDESYNFDKLVQKYREDLYINAYKGAVVSQYLESDISDSAIENYYRENKDNFYLNEALIRLKYVYFGNEIINKNMLEKWFFSNIDSDLDSLKLKKLSFKSFYLNDSVWLKYSQVLQRIPVLNEVSQTSILKNDFQLKKHDSTGTYLFDVKDVLKRGELAPLEYIKPTIYQILLQKQKLNFLKDLEKTLKEDAYKDGKIEVFKYDKKTN